MSGMDNHANFVKIDTKKSIELSSSISLTQLLSWWSAEDEKAAKRESEMSKDEHLSNESNILKY